MLINEKLSDLNIYLKTLKNSDLKNAIITTVYDFDLKENTEIWLNAWHSTELRKIINKCDELDLCFYIKNNIMVIFAP